MESFERELMLSVQLSGALQDFCKGTNLAEFKERAALQTASISASLSALLVQGDDRYLYDGHLDFKELYGHSKCYVFHEGLFELLEEMNFEPKGLAFIDNVGRVAHYVTVIEVSGIAYYCDVYGFYRDLDEIKARYKNTTISSVDGFDFYDESDLIDDYRSQLAVLSDDIPDDFSGGSLELEIEYSEAFCKQLALQMIERVLE